MLLCKDGQLKHDKHPLVEGLTRDAVSLARRGTGAENTLYILSLHHTQILFVLVLRNALVLVGTWLPV